MVKDIDPEVQESVKTMCARPADIEILADWWTVTRIGPTSSGVLVGTADLQIPLHVLQNGDTPGLGWRNTKSEEDPLKRSTGLLAARNTAHRGGEARVNRRFEAFREVRRLLNGDPVVSRRGSSCAFRADDTCRRACAPRHRGAHAVPSRHWRQSLSGSA